MAVSIVEARGCKVPIVVVGNKRDLPPEQRATVAIFDWECGYVECSAKDNDHIVEV
ncbi:Uncharacterized protein GBIM_05659 [Gryllus bimaculatus]|nr:Uncharacterized protein GBIM_05659 [Gryllus bimaculatus]